MIDLFKALLRQYCLLRKAKRQQLDAQPLDEEGNNFRAHFETLHHTAR